MLEGHVCVCRSVTGKHQTHTTVFALQEQPHVAIDFATSSATQLGVVIGGFRAVTSLIWDPAGVAMPASVARQALCSDGRVTEFHGNYNVSRTLTFTTIAEGKFDLLPASCSAAGELAEECMYTSSYIAAINTSTVVPPSRPSSGAPSGYYTLGSRTTCTSLDSFDSVGFPRRYRATPDVCQNYTTIADVYDPIDYTRWVKYRAEDAPQFPVWGGGFPSCV